MLHSVIDSLIFSIHINEEKIEKIMPWDIFSNLQQKKKGQNIYLISFYNSRPSTCARNTKIVCRNFLSLYVFVIYAINNILNVAYRNDTGDVSKCDDVSINLNVILSLLPLLILSLFLLKHAPHLNICILAPFSKYKFANIVNRKICLINNFYLGIKSLHNFNVLSN